MNDTKINNILLRKNIESLQLEKLAIQAGFYRRKPQKITAQSLLLSFFSMALQEKYSFNYWAIQLSILVKSKLSKQAVWKRCNEQQVKFLALVLKQIIGLNSFDFLKKLQANTVHLLKPFSHVYIQDSTCLSLPDRLSSSFPGHFCQGKIRAMAKIQTTFDLKTNQFAQFELGAYCKNDQKCSPDILSLIKPGDLIIRDLGYFATSVFEKIKKEKAYFLSKLRLDTYIYDLKENKINLLHLLKGKKYQDLEILMSLRKVPMRLVAIKVPDGVAEERRRKAKNSRDKRLKYGKTHLKMLGYNYYVTNVEKDKLSAHEIALVYGMRWNIEIFFKCWKSNFNLASGLKHTTWTHQGVKCYIYCMLIFIALTHTHLYHYYWWKFYKNKGIHLSLLKFTAFLANNLLLIVNLNNENKDFIEDLIAYSCKYETRNDRYNCSQKLIQLELG